MGGVITDGYKIGGAVVITVLIVILLPWVPTIINPVNCLVIDPPPDWCFNMPIPDPPKPPICEGIKCPFPPCISCPDPWVKNRSLVDIWTTDYVTQTKVATQFFNDYETMYKERFAEGMR